MGTLCAQLLQFHANGFKTLHVLWAWSEDMHMFSIYSSDYFFSQFELTSFFGHFSEWIEVPCVHNSSCSLIPILMKLYIHCDHALKICMCLGYTPQINFCHILAI